MKKLLKSVAALSLSAMMLLSPGVLAEEDEEESNVVELTTVVQEYEGKQIVLKTAGLDILEQDGYKFKDLNKNGELDPYEDWRLTPEERTEDLLSRMSDKNKAAQMAHMTLVTLKESWFSDLDIGFALTYTYFAESKESAGEKMNYVQSLCEESELGIPVVFSMDSVIGASWINDTTILPDAITLGATGDAVLRLQQALRNLRYTVTINGTYDETTRAAVLAFQKRNGRAPDGIAGVNTQTQLYTGDCVTGDTALPDENQNGGTGNNGASFGNGPAKSQIKLQMWYTEIKPTIKSGQTVLVYEPSSGSSFRLRFYSLGRHADSEPLTAQDTAIMKAAWGGKFSWDEKPVYVLLPSGTWVLASMHCMPHLSGSIKDNDFDGHLCVHFPRTMEETAKLDPKNGVRHQKDIRKAWKALTGEDITW